ncbi:YIP1 family protein [bacterium]|nr:YIP1 family protein [bacterium]
MNEINSEEKRMGVFAKLSGVFTSPEETFKSINERPNWLIPFIVVVAVSLAIQYFIMDYAFADQLKIMAARGMDAQQIELASQHMQGVARYAQFVIAPIAILIAWLIIAAVLLFAGNVIMGGEAKLKNVMAVVAWSSLVTLAGGILKAFLIVSKETTIGVTTSLAAIMPTPAIGKTPSILYRFLSKLDIFTIWQIILWSIGIAVVYKFTTKKSGTLVGIVWGTWIVLSVVLGGLIKIGVQ